MWLILPLIASLPITGCFSFPQEIQTFEEANILKILDHDFQLINLWKDAVSGRNFSEDEYSKEVLIDAELQRMLIRYVSKSSEPLSTKRNNDSENEFCFVVGDAHTVKTALAEGLHENTVVKQLSAEQLDIIMATCLNATTPRFYRYLTIFPGTNYCGAGNVAPMPGILGKKRQLDTCCYWHDLCHLSISPGTIWNNITNKGSYTISACDCDEQFSQCLSSLSTRDSRIVRYVYFEWLRLPCLRLDYPILRCLHTDWFGRCMKYAFDLTATNKEWQVVASPFVKSPSH